MKELIETGCLWTDEDCKWENFFEGEVTQENILKFASTFCDRCLKVRQIGALEDLEELRDLSIRLGGIEDAIDRMDLDIPVGFGGRKTDRYREDYRREDAGRYGLDWFERRYPWYPRDFGDYRDRRRDLKDWRRDGRY